MCTYSKFVKLTMNPVFLFVPIRTRNTPRGPAFCSGAGWGEKNQFAQNKMRRVFSRGRLANTINSKTLLEFEKAIVCASYGYDNPSDYHMSTEPIDALKNIKVKTLILASEDDPLTGDPFDMVNAKGNEENICCCSVPSGVHLGFFMTENKEVFMKSWADKVCKDFFLHLNDLDYEQAPAVQREQGGFVASISQSTPPIKEKKGLGPRRSSIRATLLGF